MKSEIESNKRFWNDSAPNWKNQSPCGGLIVDIRKYINNCINIALPSVPSTMPILDLGAGANSEGYFDKAVVSRIYGLDLAIKMLKLSQIDHKINASIGDALPIKDSSVGMVVSCFAMRYQTRKDHIHILKECGRVLVPGGKLLIFDIKANSYENQQSTFDPEQLMVIARSCGFSPVSSTIEFIGTSTRTGWGVDYNGADIKLLYATKPERTKMVDPDQKLVSTYLQNSGEDEDELAKARKRVFVGAF